jgi:two-component system, sensor histidine kinase and response regulator
MYDFKDIYQYSKSLCVLYVEDDVHLLTETKDLLEDFFDCVKTAVDGVDGLEKYKEFKKEKNRFFDLIITDINMPRMDGMELIKNIMGINPEQSIIVVSAYNESERLIQLIQEGIANFVMKPIASQQLMQILYKTCKSVSNQNAKESLIVQQSKMATMGEMMDSIAHQWKQPLGILKLQEHMLKLKNDENDIEKDTIDQYIDEHSKQLNHLVETIDQFRSFFKDDTKIEKRSLRQTVDETTLLIKDYLTEHSVEIHVDIRDEIDVNIIQTEFKHVLINLITNAIEAFNETNASKLDRRIQLNVVEDERIKLIISDNAGGIPEDAIGYIFEQNYTTKKTGTGVGLHLVTKILDKIGAVINVANDKEGAVFTIVFTKNDQ